MELLKRLVVEEEGQGLVEYTLIVLLVALVFWVAIRSTNVGTRRCRLPGPTSLMNSTTRHRVHKLRIVISMHRL